MPARHAPRSPRKPEGATARGVLRPILLIIAAIVLTPVLIGGALYLLTPEPDLRPGFPRVVIVNSSHRPLTNVGLRASASSAPPPARLVASVTEIPDGERWILEDFSGADVGVDLVFEIDGTSYEFHRAAALLREGDLRVLTVTPGPRLKRSESSFPAPPDLVSEP